MSVENGGLRGGGTKLKNSLWEAARSTMEEWTGQELTQCSLYGMWFVFQTSISPINSWDDLTFSVFFSDINEEGIRVYTEGSILAPHVDRLPLVSSAIINVAQDTDEPWPIEVYGHDGTATNVTMEPGDMVSATSF